MNIGEFFVTLGVKADTTKLKDFVRSVAELPIEAAGAIGALAGISFKLKDIAEEAINAAVGFEAFTDQTGLSSQELQQWQIVAQQANVSAEAVSASVSALQKNLAEIRLGRGNISPFQMLGISADGNAFDVLKQLRERIKGLDRPTATNLISQMGLSPELISVLTLSEQKFREFSSTVSGQSEKQTQALLKAKLGMVQFSLVVKQLGLDVVIHLIERFGQIVHWLEELWAYLGRSEAALMTFKLSLGILAIAFAPLTAALALLLLILDDVAGYFNGEDSLTGDAIEGLKVLFDSPIESAKVLLDVINQIISKLTGGDLKESVKALWGDPSGAGAVIRDMLLTGKADPYADQKFPGLDLKNPAGTTIHQENNYDIKVTASGTPEENAKAIQREIKRSAGQAALQLDNAGL